MPRAFTQYHSLPHYSVIQVAGNNAQTFLQGQLTCDMRPLSQHGHYSLAACCDHRGRMIANFWVVKWRDDFLIILPESMSSILMKRLGQYAPLSRVQLKSGLDHLAILFCHDHKPPETHDHSVAITLPNQNRHLLIGNREQLPTQGVNEDDDHWRAQNIIDGLVMIYPETSLLFLPQMINLQNLGGISFEKGCYVGQEIIARTQHLGTLKRHLQRLTLLQNSSPKPGEILKNYAEKPMGIVVEAVKIQEGKIDALAVIQD